MWVTANVAADERTTAGNAAMAPEIAAVVSPVSTEKAADVQTAAAKPAVGSKRKVHSILTLLTGRVSSEVDPVGTQGDRANRGEINPKGLEVAETTGPQASQGETDPDGIEVTETIGPSAEFDEGIIAAPHA